MIRRRYLTPFLLLLLLLSLTLSACGELTGDATYICEDLSFTIPATMQYYTYTAQEILDMGEDADQRFDVICSNESVAFRAKHLTAAFLEKQGADPTATPIEYARYYTELNYGDNASRCGLTEDEETGFATFYYGDSTDEGETYYFYYVTVLRAHDGLWFVEMICPEDDRTLCTPTFRTWQKALRLVES